MKKVLCKNCRHFLEAPYEAPHTGCWHPDNMTVKQKLAYLDEQRKPGDHERINLRGNCEQFEQKPGKLTFWERILRLGA